MSTPRQIHYAETSDGENFAHLVHRVGPRMELGLNVDTAHTSFEVDRVSSTDALSC